MTIISLIVAMDEHRVIGYQNQLPWHLPADLQHFKQLTLGKPILMGRNTFESIGKPLPQRPNIVLTRDVQFQAEGVLIAHSLQEACALANDAAELMVIGGAHVFQQTLPLAHRMYLTKIHHRFVGDTYFPQWDAKAWQEIESTFRPADEKNAYDMTFITLVNTLK